MVFIGLITGICGQDGSYLAELLLSKNYIVYGIVRRSSSINTKRIDHIYSRIRLRYGDLSDTNYFVNILQEIKEIPDLERIEIYNLGAMSHVKVSFEIPEYTSNVNGLGVLRILEAVRTSDLSSIIRFYQASTSELYGKVLEIPQNENTPFYPRSPYGISKLYAYWITKNYREAYSIYACNGILFNHESPRRGETFVTKKITIGLNNIVSGKSDRLILGNLDAQRDWGHAIDYVYGMWLMMQQDKPDDFVLAMSEVRSVREFVETAFKFKGFDILWKGSGVSEIGYDKNTGKELIFISDRYFRPTEVDLLLGDATKAKKVLNWKPEYTFTKIVEEMVTKDN